MCQNLDVTDLGIPVLLVRVGELTCAVKAGDVLETMRPLPVTPMDGMPSCARGVATIRGVTTPVVDLADLLRHPGAGPTRFVTIQANERVVALAVDEVLGVSTLNPADFESRPPLLASADSALVSMLAKKDAALYLVLDAARLVDEGGAAR